MGIEIKVKSQELFPVSILLQCNGDTGERPGFRQNMSGFRHVMFEKQKRHLGADLLSE